MFLEGQGWTRVTLFEEGKGADGTSSIGAYVCSVSCMNCIRLSCLR